MFNPNNQTLPNPQTTIIPTHNLPSQPSSSSSSSSLHHMMPSNMLAIGYIFKPTISDIYTTIFPQIFFHGPHYQDYENVIKTVDLYGRKPPGEIFQRCRDDDGDKVAEFYVLTCLKMHKERVKRVVEGKGTWSKQHTDDIQIEIQGNIYEAGKKGLFKFKYSEENKDKDDGVSWIMYEYSLNKDYLDYLLKQQNLQITDSFRVQLEKTVLCHIKMDKKMQTTNKRKINSKLFTTETKKTCYEADANMDLHTKNTDDHNLSLENNKQDDDLTSYWMDMLDFDDCVSQDNSSGEQHNALGNTLTMN